MSTVIRLHGVQHLTQSSTGRDEDSFWSNLYDAARDARSELASWQGPAGVVARLEAAPFKECGGAGRLMSIG